MKKKGFRIFLAGLLCLTMLAPAAMAEDETGGEAAPLPETLEISGPDTVSVPGTAQYGVYAPAEGGEFLPLKDDLIHWTVEGDPAGISIEEQSGFLTVTDEAAGEAVALRVTYGDETASMWAEKSVRLIREEVPAVAAVTIGSVPEAVAYGDPLTLTATVQNAGDGGEWLWETGDSEVLALPDSAAPADTCTLWALKAGTADVTVTYAWEGQTVSDSMTITVDRRTLTVRAEDQTMTRGGALPELTIQYGGLAEGDTIKTVLAEPAQASTEADGQTAGSFPITVSAPVLLDSWTDKYQVGTLENGTLTVRARSSGGSSSSSSTKTETATNPDGSVTRTETRADGTMTVTTTYPDGSSVKTVTRPDGSADVERRSADGSVGTLHTDVNGQVTGRVGLSERAIEEAKENGGAVIVPVEVDAARNSIKAPVIDIVLPSGAGETRIKIPVGNVNSGTVAVIVYPDGTEEILKTSVAGEDGVELTVSGDVQIKLVDNSKDFADTRDHWARDDLNYVIARELFQGIDARDFGVSQPMTRGMVNTVLARLDGVDTTPPTDGKWYEIGTAWAKNNGISDGTAPGSAITREQLAAMLYRFSGSPETSGSLPFRDAQDVSGYAQDALTWAVRSGVINGYADGRLAPTEQPTRAQTAAILARYLKGMR